MASGQITFFNQSTVKPNLTFQGEENIEVIKFRYLSKTLLCVCFVKTKIKLLKKIYIYFLYIYIYIYIYILFFIFINK